MSCVFCRIIAGELPAYKVYEDAATVVFLDAGPLFPGHCLVCPKQHVDNMLTLPDGLIAPLFGTARLIGKAVERGLAAEGSLMAINNTVSQSVPHLHVHVIPRKRRDGLKGFFWPRRPYRDEQEIQTTQQALIRAVEELQNGGGA